MQTLADLWPLSKLACANQKLLGLVLKALSIDMIPDSTGTAFKEITMKSLQNPDTPVLVEAILTLHKVHKVNLDRYL